VTWFRRCGKPVGPSVMGTQVKVEIDVEGQPRRLPVPVEMNLLRIGQEAVTNAIKHAHAQHITLNLRYDLENGWSPGH